MDRKDIRWEQKSSETKKRLLGGTKTTTVSNQMEYTGVVKSRSKKPVKIGEATTVTKTNKKGDVVREKKVIIPSSGPKTVVTTNRSGKQKINTKGSTRKPIERSSGREFEPKVRKRHMK